MARKVLEVFLSSTGQDLAPYREAVYERLRRIEFFHCVRQEDFGAQDSHAVDFCCEKARAANLFIGLIGMRRGWEPEGDDAKRSITEMEYDWAKGAGRRRFVYVSPASFPVPGNLRETAAQHKRLLAFRTRIMGERIVSQKGFDSPELLASEIVERLLAYVVASDLIGELHPEFVRKDMSSADEQRPAVAAAVERLAEDQDVDLLALAKNPKNADLADLEAKLKARAEVQEAQGQAALKTGAEYWRHIGALAFLHNTQKALAAYEKAAALDPLDAEGWRYLGELHYRLGDLARAEQSFERVLALGKSTNDLKTQAMGFMRLGWISRDHGDLANAEALATEAVRSAEAGGWQEGMARAYGNLGLIHYIRGYLSKAKEMHLKSLKLEEKLSNKEGMARAYGNLGIVHWNLGDLDKAEEMQHHALTLYKEVNSKEGMARVYVNLGNIHLDRGDLDEAEEVYRQGLTLCEEVGNKETMATAYFNFGVIHDNRGDFGDAEEMYLKALKLNEELGRKEGMANAYGNLGSLCQSKGDKASMCDFWRKERDLWREMKLLDKVAEVEKWLKQNKCADR